MKVTCHFDKTVPMATTKNLSRQQIFGCRKLIYMPLRFNVNNVKLKYHDEEMVAMVTIL